MDYVPLVTEEIEAGTQFLAEFDKQFLVRTAFWLREDEGFRWYLYVASDRIGEVDIRVPYLEAGRIAKEMNDPYFSSTRVKFIKTDHPFAQAALDVQQRYPGKSARFRDTFGGRPIEEVYIYPLPLAVP
jgi:hypothetical protein